MNKVDLTPLEYNDIDEMVSAFKNIGWQKPKMLYEMCLSEQTQHKRFILVAKINNTFCGYVTLKWQTEHLPFSDNHIAEIADLNVLPHFRNKGIGTQLIQACESTLKEKGYAEIGLGVGMTADYGNAQRLYVHLGYVPDGRGLYYKDKQLSYSD